MLDEGLIDEDTGAAPRRRGPARGAVQAPREGRRTPSPIAKGLNASPGAATGKVVFTADDAEARAKDGEKVDPRPPRDDARRLPRHDRGAGDPDERGRDELARGGRRARRGDPRGVRRRRDPDRPRGASASPRTARRSRRATSITIDGFTGNVYVGELPLEESVLEKARSGDAEAREEKIWRAFERLMALADARRRLRVRANADTPDQSTNARERGAEGIGLCRTEHMFLGEERVAAVRQMIFADDPRGGAGGLRRAAAAAARATSSASSERWTGCRSRCGCSTRRCTSSCPNHVELAVEVARARGARRGGRLRDERVPLERGEGILGKVEQLHEANPMLGLRGVRLGIVKPGLYAMQVRAICEAAVEVKQEGGDPKVEIMIPLVATEPELEQMRDGARARCGAGPREGAGVELDTSSGGR